MAELSAFIGGALAGMFHRRDSYRSLENYVDYAGNQLSTSLSLVRSNSSGFILAFLENHLLDNGSARLRWVHAGPLPAAGSGDLLATCGKDVTGAVPFSADHDGAGPDLGTITRGHQRGHRQANHYAA